MKIIRRIMFMLLFGAVAFGAGYYAPTIISLYKGDITVTEQISSVIPEKDSEKTFTDMVNNKVTELNGSSPTEDYYAILKKSEGDNTLGIKDGDVAAIYKKNHNKDILIDTFTYHQ